MSFNIIADFDSSESARSAMAEIERIMHKIADWYSENDMLSAESQINNDTSIPSPVEIEIGQAYGIRWAECHHWLAVCPDLIGDAVSVYGNTVFVSNPCATHAHEKPFDEILQKLGGRVMQELPGQSAIFVRATCIAPNEAVTDEIYGLTIRYFEYGFGIPWLIYHGGQRDPKADELLQIEGKLAERHQGFYQWLKENPEYRATQQALLEARERGDKQQEAALRERHSKLRDEAFDTLAHSRKGEEERVRSLSMYLSATGTIAKHQLLIEFSEISFSSLENGLPAFIEWLTEKGCKDIKYEFVYTILA